MANNYFTNTITLQAGNKVRASGIEAKLASVEAGLDKLPDPTLLAKLGITAAPSNISNDPASTAYVAAATAALSAQMSALQVRVDSASGLTPVWSSTTTYAAADRVSSPITFFDYRRKVAGVNATDPSNDKTNWVQLTGLAVLDDPAFWMM